MRLPPRFQSPSRTGIVLSAAQATALDAFRSRMADGTYRVEIRPCPICGGVDFLPLARTDRYGLATVTVACRRCDLVQTNPVLRAEDYARFYSDHYRQLYGGGTQASAAQREHALQRGRRITDTVAAAGVTGGSVLEVGSGAGGALQAFSERGFACTGLEVDIAFGDGGAPETAYRRLKGTIHSFEPASPPTLVVYDRVLEHIVDLPHELTRIRSLMAAESHLFISVPGLWGVMNAKRGPKSDFLQYLHPAHLFHFTLLTLTKVMGAHGFERVMGTESIDSLWRPGPVRRWDEHDPALAHLLASQWAPRLYRAARAGRALWRRLPL